MSKDEARYEVVHEDKSAFTASRVLRDRDTGVCHLFHWEGSAGGLTVLLDADGAPLVVP